jgi:hypothetical protein
MIDKALQKMVKEVHPQLRAVWWCYAYYVMCLGKSSRFVKNPFSFSIAIWKPVLLHLNQPNWYDKFATKTGTAYKLRPEYDAAANILAKLTTLAEDANKIDERIKLDIAPWSSFENCHSLNIRARLPFQKTQPDGPRATWHKQIFLHPDDCHNLISPTIGYLLTSLKDMYEHLRAEHEHQTMRQMALRQAHHENDLGINPAAMHSDQPLRGIISIQNSPSEPPMCHLDADIQI